MPLFLPGDFWKFFPARGGREMARLGQFGNNAIRTLLVEGKGERQFFRLFKRIQDLVTLFRCAIR